MGDEIVLARERRLQSNWVERTGARRFTKGNGVNPAVRRADQRAVAEEGQVVNSTERSTRCRSGWAGNVLLLCPDERSQDLVLDGVECRAVSGTANQNRALTILEWKGLQHFPGGLRAIEDGTAA